MQAATLSPRMREAINLARRHDGRLIRYVCGFWAQPYWNGIDRPFNTPTITALVARGVAEFTAYQFSGGVHLPTEISLTEAGRLA